MKSQKVSTKGNTLRLAGFSIAEILIALSIFSLVLSGGFFLNLDMFTVGNFLAEEKVLLALLKESRSRALANFNEISHGVFVGSDKFFIFAGEDFSNSEVLEEFNRNKKVKITLDEEENFEIVFEKRSARVKEKKEIMISDGARKSFIFIGLEGEIKLR